MKGQRTRIEIRFAALLAFMTAVILSVSACSNAIPANPVIGEEPAGSSEQDAKPLETAVIAEPAEDEADPEPAAIDYVGELELPLIGATGYTTVRSELKGQPDKNSKAVVTLEPGTAFVILEEEGDWWLVERDGQTGWLPHRYCFVNLPDVIPSIIYDNTNTYASKFHSSHKSIPNITNESLYEGNAYNERLGREQYIMPVLYTMSKKIHKAQQLALKSGHSLKIYEAFRPYSVQKSVAAELMALAQKDPAVMEGISTPPWGLSWFIVDGTSNHQRGYAIDVSLVKVHSEIKEVIGSYNATRITDYTEYEMPTPIHELSKASAIFTESVPVHSDTAWRDAVPSASMNEPAFALQAYCTDAGLTPLASEWWHFNDLEAKSQVENKKSTGQFILSEVMSSPPTQKKVAS
ncbi:M15 family metallopeptidase [Paenibacillus soyae]|uniref:SH3 domain-containing protein n=1 Tax=Paenibacillus soyae TaxID=2969249 RepID=A0A9X2MU19_9BACL|nr:SH3 domain-containing protein [Paenibacillus soyae]MCR2807928.1 SH3 domain-containing protein [Paenibacillus soyae]